MRLTEEQIKDTVNKLRMEQKLKDILIDRCLKNDPSARFAVYCYFKNPEHFIYGSK